VVTLQAGAAARVLDRDPDAARRALGAIEESARTALADLDHVLGLLREEKAPVRAPQPTLQNLDRLLAQTRLAGTQVRTQVEGNLDLLPAAVSREAYRIVQEGLTNSLRHAGEVPVTLRLAVRRHELELELTNPLATDPAAEARRGGGGRGLAGIRERVAVLRGDMTAAADDGRWRIKVRLPL
jgi:signal transduction histidine kinase